MPQRTITPELPVVLHQFDQDVSQLVYPARSEYFNRLLAGEKDSSIIQKIQPKYEINQRLANAIRAEVKVAISSAKECRANHIKLLRSKIKSINTWLNRNNRALTYRIYAKYLRWFIACSTYINKN